MIFEKVKEFHLAFDQLVSDKLEFPDQSTRDLRKRLLKEEYIEWTDAEDQNDIVEIADALTDMTYILSGTFVSYGIFAHDIPNNWRPLFFDTSLEGVKPALPSDDLRTQLLNRFEIFYKTYIAMEENNSFSDTIQVMYALLDEISSVAVAYGIPLKACFEEVHASNMSKLDPITGKAIKREDGKVLKGENYFKPNLKKILFPDN